MGAGCRRFEVALSFAGARRTFVELVAARLVETLGRARLLYDDYHPAEFAQPNQSVYLQNLYHDESELIAVFLSSEYVLKNWCGLEWRAILDLINRGRGESVILFRFDGVEVPGLFEGDAALWIGDRSPDQIASLILDRLKIRRGGHSGFKPSRSQAGSGSRPGAIAPSRLAVGQGDLLGRTAELARLTAAWDEGRIHVMALIAWGGVGKTSLVGRWAAGLVTRSDFNASYFDWSFSHQGSSDSLETSDDQFIDAALRHFGAPEFADSRNAGGTKGAYLAELVSRRRALLVLDGLEPLQHWHGALEGALRTPATKVLLQSLAVANTGLCVVTSRKPIADLDRFRGISFAEDKLERLETRDGARLLSSLGVIGSEADLDRIVEHADGHALTLRLLGKFLCAIHGGEVGQANLASLLEVDRELEGGQAFRIIQAYERYFETAGEFGQRQLSALRLLGLFDRPASSECLRKLREEPAIAGLTESLVGLSENQWLFLLSHLEMDDLIVRNQETVDVHPLLREFFADRVRLGNPKGWSVAQGRIFDFLVSSSEAEPNDIPGLQPWYQSVHHGCQAGRQEQAWAVYWGNILRGEQGFSWRRLGAFGANLEALRRFFTSPWTTVSQELSQKNGSLVLSEAAFSLRALGRMGESIRPWQEALARSLQAKTKDWRHAGWCAANLCELKLTVGEIDVSLAIAEKAVKCAEESNHPHAKMISRTAAAIVRHQRGEFRAAMAEFELAEKYQADWKRDAPLLYAIAGFRFCEMILDPVELAAGIQSRRRGTVAACSEIFRRTALTLRWADEWGTILCGPLSRLSLGRAQFFLSILSRRKRNLSDSARINIDKAVVDLRNSGRIDYLPFGLTTRAWQRCALGDYSAARADLDEAEMIAKQGSMNLHLVDIALQRARLFGDQDALAEGKSLVQVYGYRRRLSLIEQLESTLGSRPQAPWRMVVG
jgi:hypothetical protein